MCVNKRENFVLGRIENVVRKGEDVGYQYPSPFPHNVFKKASFSGSSKIGIVWLKVNTTQISCNAFSAKGTNTTSFDGLTHYQTTKF